MMHDQKNKILYALDSDMARGDTCGGKHYRKYVLTIPIELLEAVDQIIYIDSSCQFEYVKNKFGECKKFTPTSKQLEDAFIALL
jgi:hypothetical protein